MLTFDHDTHTYYWNGAVIPGVSHFLEQAGFKATKGFYAPGSAERGTIIHELTELYDLGLIPADAPIVKTHTEEIQGHFKAWVRFRKESGFLPVQVELQVCNPVLWLAGTIDRVGFFGDRPAVLDLKTGAKADWHRYQLAAYNAIRESRASRYCIYTKKDGTYKIQPWTNDGDYLEVLKALERVRGVSA